MIGDNSLPDYPSLRACRDIQLIANPVATVAPELTNFRLEEKNEAPTTLYYLPKPHLPPSQGAWYCVFEVHGTAFEISVRNCWAEKMPARYIRIRCARCSRPKIGFRISTPP